MFFSKMFSTFFLFVCIYVSIYSAHSYIYILHKFIYKFFLASQSIDLEIYYILSTFHVKHRLLLPFFGFYVFLKIFKNRIRKNFSVLFIFSFLDLHTRYMHVSKHEK